jgi:hypothetical protein
MIISVFKVAPQRWVESQPGNDHQGEDTIRLLAPMIPMNRFLIPALVPDAVV